MEREFFPIEGEFDKWNKISLESTGKKTKPKQKPPTKTKKPKTITTKNPLSLPPQSPKTTHTCIKTV